MVEGGHGCMCHSSCWGSLEPWGKLIASSGVAGVTAQAVPMTGVLAGDVGCLGCMTTVKAASAQHVAVSSQPSPRVAAGLEHQN